MAEQLPKLSEIVINLAWDAAEASNDAFGTIKLTEANLDRVTPIEPFAVQGIPIINPEAMSVMRQQHIDAQSYFDILTGMAAPAMLHDNSPFNLGSTKAETKVEPIDIPSIEKETMDRIEALSSEFGDLVLTTYASAVNIKTGLRGRISELKGKFYPPLPDEAAATKRQIVQLEAINEILPVPNLNELIGKVEEVAADFEQYIQKGWEPAVDFVLRGLSREQWDALLAGYDLPNGAKTNGAYSTFEGNEIVGPYTQSGNSDEAQVSWGVIVYNSTQGPVFRNVSKDGVHDSNAKKVVKELAGLPSVTDTSTPEAVIAQASPTRDAYNSAQLGRIMRGQEPLDVSTWTIGRGNVNVGGGLRSVFLNFYPNVRQVGSCWYNRDDSDDCYGVRPSAER